MSNSLGNEKRKGLANGRKERTLGAMLVLVCVVVLAAACGGSQDTSSAENGSGDGSSGGSGGGTQAASGGQMYPDIQEAELESEGGNSYTLSVTVSSSYDSPERYADGWRVLTPSGEVLGKRELTHEHSATQPFTRSQSGLRIPDGVNRITVEGRDLENGYGGETVTIPVEG